MKITCYISEAYIGYHIENTFYEWHREDGPAVEYFDGRKYWYLYGEELPCNSQEEFEKLLKLKAFL